MKKIIKCIMLILFCNTLYCEGISLTANIPNYVGLFNPNIGIEIPTMEKQSITISAYSANLVFFQGYGIDGRYRFYSGNNNGVYAGPYLSLYHCDLIKLFDDDKSKGKNGILTGCDIGYKAKINNKFSVGFGIIPIYNYTFSDSSCGWAFLVDIMRLNYTF